MNRYNLNYTNAHRAHIPGTSSISVAAVDSVVDEDVVVSAAFDVGEGIFRFVYSLSAAEVRLSFSLLDNFL